MGDEITREERERLIGRRIRAIDLGLAALLQTVEREAPDDTTLIEQFRVIASNIRTTLAARYSFARDEIGSR